MESTPERLANRVDKFKGVDSVSVYVSVTVGNGIVRESQQCRVSRLRSQRSEVPKRVRILFLYGGKRGKQKQR